MMTKSIWALAAVLSSAACSSGSGDGTSTAAQGASDAGVSTGASGAKAPAANSGSAGTRGSANVSTGSVSSAGTGATSTGASGAAAPSKTGSAGKAGTAGSAGSAGHAGAVADDSDAGTPEDVSNGPAAGSGGTAGRGAAGKGAAGRGAAGRGAAAAGTGAAGAAPDKPSTSTLDVPKDPGAKGPWAVGVKTVSLDLGAGATTPVEVWYPAKPGSAAERQKVSYDLTEWLPPEHGIPADAPKVQIECDCYRELAPDLDHGPFPIVVIVHGQASFRAAAAAQMAHWASRGYIAIAADHPGLLLRDRLAGAGGCTGTGIPQDVGHVRDVQAIFRALAEPKGIFGFLMGALDPERVALGGHGDGAAYASDNTDQPGVRAVLSFSDANVVPRAELKGGVFYLTGSADKIVAYDTVLAAYNATALAIQPTLLAGMSNVGHLGFTDLCGARNSDGQDAIASARRYNVCGGAAINLADQYLWDCPLSPLAGSDNYLDQAASTALVSKLSTLALEELLLGQDHTQDWATLAADKTWGELRQSR